MTAVGTALVVRDRLLRRIPRSRGIGLVSRHEIASGCEALDAVLVRPHEGMEIGAAVLICHGIGETVDYWIRVQEMMAEWGIASLVFNYSGCGRSSGWITPECCERDAVSAFDWLQNAVPEVSITLLGFSLGSGVASAVANRLPIERLVLCEAYTSFRAASRATGLPGFAVGMVPDVWRSADALRDCKVPVLVLHGECDRLFPVAMGAELAAAAGTHGKLAVIQGMGHSDLHRKARKQDWRVILECVTGPTESEDKA